MSTPTNSPSKATKRDPRATRQRLLEAAFIEFSAYGPAGARVERIVDRAGVNPRMLYHYFGSKAGLFSELIARKSEEMAGRRASASGAIPDIVAAVARQQFEDRGWARLLMWEALAYGESEIALEAERSAAWAEAIDGVRGLQAAGVISQDLDPAQFQLSLIALATFPVAFPNTSKMVTGMDPLSEEFITARESAVRGLLREIIATPGLD